MKKCKYSIFILAFVIMFHSNTESQTPAPAGMWKFDDKNNLLKAFVGKDLELVGSQSMVEGPTADNGAVRIGKGSYLKMNHALQPNGGGSLVNEYTLQIDFRVSDISIWHSFFQTSATNSNYAELFINTSGKIGVTATGYSNFSVKPNEWYRLIISVKNGSQFNFYIDGQLIHNGFYQAIDGRFALENILLLFADNDGEDGEIDCAEVAVWNSALTNYQVSSLSGYGHVSKLQILVPYLQNPTPTSIYICWHDSLSIITKVEYGTTSALGQTANSTSETVISPYIWHTVKLTGLQPNTEYFYKVSSGSGSSKIYSFRTQPSNEYKGKIRILVLSDTHASDTTMAVKLIKEAKKKIQLLYGNDFQNKINLVLHCGDLVMEGFDIKQWTDEYFVPMSPISPNIPFMTVTGNHEEENINYYQYMKYDDVSGYPNDNQLNERFWSINIANTVFIGLNSNLNNSSLTRQTEWLNKKLSEIEQDLNIDFVVLNVHHMPLSELWGEGMNDDGSVYIRNQIIPVLKKYSKVTQLNYGHTHGFERGTIESDAVNSNGDFRIVCNGGGGGPIDRWGYFKNQDYKNIHISFDHYCYQIIEIDAGNKTFESYLYSLGNFSKGRDSELMDYWYRKLNQPAPINPVASNPIFEPKKIIFNTSKLISDSLMTVKLQVSDNINFSTLLIDEASNWKNIYGAANDFTPIDLNKGIDLTRLQYSRQFFVNEKKYFYRVKYRDHNLRWSDWSNIVSFVVPQNIGEDGSITDYNLDQNYPNPFNAVTRIIYQVPEYCFVSLIVYDVLGNEVAVLVNKEKRAGRYEATLESNFLSSGVYFYKLQTEKFTQTKKLIIIK